MSRVGALLPLQASVLDRLLDDDPKSQQEPRTSSTQRLRELHQSVRRDLENLLNTRRRVIPRGSRAGEIPQSILGYGLTDFQDSELRGIDGRDTTRRMIEATIRRFEPRFSSVKVRLLENIEPLDRTLRFRIDALLNVDPAPEPLSFDSHLEPVTGNFSLKESRS